MTLAKDTANLENLSRVLKKSIDVFECKPQKLWIPYYSKLYQRILRTFPFLVRTSLEVRKFLHHFNFHSTRTSIVLNIVPWLLKSIFTTLQYSTISWLCMFISYVVCRIVDPILGVNKGYTILGMDLIRGRILLGCERCEHYYRWDTAC